MKESFDECIKIVREKVKSSDQIKETIEEERNERITNGEH
jgi:hypothetical protein